MSVGIDLSGRALRWQSEDAPVETRHVLLGCPPFDSDERISWNNPKAFRPQVCARRFGVAQGDNEPAIFTADLLAIEDVWSELAQGKDVWQKAAYMADALRAYWPGLRDDQGKLAFAIPNRLNEDAQDALLRALGGLHADVSLLWRPVAAMLYWLVADNGQTVFPDKQEIEDNGAVWVLDLDSAGFEMTRLTWKRHARENKWIAPVRACATEAERKGDRHNTCPVLNTAWSELFGGIPEHDQLRWCQTAPDVQKWLESASREFDVWVANDLRWRKVHAQKPEALQRTWQELRRMCHARIPAPAEGDVVLVHGWLTRLNSGGLERMLAELWTGRTIRILPITAVAEGARLFAQRRAEGLPTYYDTLPEYRIWTSQGSRQLVAPHQEVEPGAPWQLPADSPLRTAFCINRHRDIFSMLVRRLPCDDPEYDYARRLRVGLHKPLTNERPLTIDATVEAARGNARFTVTAQGDERHFVSKDGKEGINTVTLTYARDPEEDAQGKETLPEPEHKGYLEAQPVIGRIHDDPANVEMLRLLVRCWSGEQGINGELGNAVRHYRTDKTPPPIWHARESVTLDALFRWGYHANPMQPTRGLFGTRSLPNREISELAMGLATHLLNSPELHDGTNSYAKYQNYMHVLAHDDYKAEIRRLLRDRDLPVGDGSFNHQYAAGYVLGDEAGDLSLLIDYCLDVNFGDIDASANLWWAFFRMLCWHKEVAISPTDVSRFLERLVVYVRAPVPGGLPLQGKKNALFAILFALRVREAHSDFLMNNNDDLRASLLALIDPQGLLSRVQFPRTMVANMAGVKGTFSDYVKRFIRKEDTIEDRELGAAIGTMQ